MAAPNRVLVGAGCAVLLLCLASPSTAQISDQLTAYTGDNAIGYLQPLANAIGADLNSGLYRSAHIPETGLNINLEIRVMSVLFADDDRTFTGTTESGFSPEQEAEAPTVVGSGESVSISGDGGSTFTFPGGLDLHSFTLGVPQLRIGSFRGTEALIRYIALDIGETDIGKVSLYGFGLRHSISQYLGPTFPVDVAGGFFWQSFSLGGGDSGDDLLSSSALSFGVQASKSFAIVEPYVGVSMDRFSMEASYESEASGTPEQVDLDFETDTSFRLTAGLNLSLGLVSANAEYSIAGQNTFALGLSFGS